MARRTLKTTGVAETSALLAQFWRNGNYPELLPMLRAARGRKLVADSAIRHCPLSAIVAQLCSDLTLFERNYAAHLEELRRIAREAMQALEPFSPHVMGCVVEGWAVPDAQINLLVDDSLDALSEFLVSMNIAWTWQDWPKTEETGLQLIVESVPLTLWPCRAQRASIRRDHQGQWRAIARRL